jgi:hypothetical protein
MSDNTIDTFEVKNLTVHIELDTDPMSPLEWDNIGKMVCWHRRYNLGHEQPLANPDEYVLDQLDESIRARLERWHEKESDRIFNTYKPYGSSEHLTAERNFESDYRAKIWAEFAKIAVTLPLYLYDHSGITMRCSPFSCPWDSGQVGFIFITNEKIRSEYSCKRITSKIRQRVQQALIAEVSTYDDYLTGSVYGFIVKNEDGDELDSCWGFYGLDYCKQEAHESAEHHAKA